jgi:protein DGCR14
MFCGDRPRSPEIAGYSLVPTLPSPTPDQMGPSGMKKLMTVGQIMSTPRVLSTEEPDITPDTPFHLPKPTQREVIAQRLSSRASRSLKSRAALMGETPRAKRSMDPPSMTPRRMPSDLTPAARRLLDRTVGGSVASNRRGDAMNKLSVEKFFQNTLGHPHPNDELV